MAKGILVFLFAFIIAFHSTVHPQTTEFTYQGSLNNGTNPASGNHDFQFLLFDTISGGNQIGGTITLTNVAVTSGVFSVRLDFGTAFPGANRFLEIKVRPSGQSSFTTLVPRQPIGSTPYAVKSLSAENATQLGGIPASQYVVTTDPRMSDARNPLPNSTSYIRNSTDRQIGSNFNVSGDGLVGGVLSADAVNSATQFNIGGQRVFSVVGSGNTFAGMTTGTGGRSNSFFGTSAGAATTSGETNSFFGNVAGTSTTSGDANSFFGAAAGRLNSTGQLNSFFGYRAGELSTTSSDNAFFGAHAGAANTVGVDNSFFGRSAGAANTSALGNAFFGRSAGAATTLGSSNAFFGAYSGTDNTIGAFNSFFGSFAGNANTTGASNSFFGRSAGFGNTVGNENAFFGRRSGESNTTGIQNSFVGAFAGLNNVSGGGNTFMGSAAGESNITGNFNTAIGISSDVGSGNLTFATAIGANTIVSSSNTIQLGRSNGSDLVRIPGLVELQSLAPAGALALCRNGASGHIASCSSSLRYKTDIVTFTSGLQLISRLRPISFTWKDGGMRDLGLAAEEVAELEPLLVTHNSKGEVEGVKYDRIGVIAVNAIKEQQVQIEAQAKEIAEQKDENRRLKERLDSVIRFVCQSNPASEICKEEK